MRPYTDIEQSRLGTMTQAEKAKRFDEAFRLAKEQHQYPWVRESKDVLEEIFPELRESDDEKIRKWLIGTIKQIPDDSIEWKTICKSDVLAWLDRPSELKHKFNIGDIISNGQVVYRVCNITKNCIGQDCYFLVNVESEKDGTRYLKLTDPEGKQHNLGEITWLCEQVDKSFEKQGEQKSANKIEPKFREGDWIVQENIGVYKVIEICESWYEVVDGEDNHYSISFDKEYMCRLWDIAKDAKDGDAIQLGGVTAIFKEYISNPYCKCYCSVYDEEFGIPRQDGEDNIYGCTNATPATKEQRDLLFQKMKESGYEFDFDKFELKKIEDEPKSHEGDSIYKVASTDDGFHYEWNDDKHELKKIEDEPTPITEDYNPYEAAVKSIAKMCKRYDRMDLDSLQDFYDNVKVKCKDAVDYDSLYLQNAKD